MSSSPDAMDSLEEGAWLFDLIDQLERDRKQDRLRPLGDYLGRFPGDDRAVAREYLAAAAAGATDLPAWPLEGERLGPYRIESECARGGQGVVYFAVDERDQHRVAVKVLCLPPALLSARQRARFRREARIVANLSHPGLCGLEAACVDAHLPYIVMPRLEGQPLATHIRGTPRPEPRVISVPPRTRHQIDALLEFFERVARALHVAHEAGVVHRDIKPGNIMVQPDGNPVIFDFGLACFEEAEGSRITRSHETFGTPAYMAPEQFEGRALEPDRRCDLFALGVTLYECVTGRRPHGDGPRVRLLQAIRNRDRPAAATLNPALPADLDRVLDVALDPERGRRQGSALDLAEDLRALREGRRPRSRPPSGLVRLGRWCGRHPRMTILLLALLPILGGGLALTQVLLGEARRATREAQGLYLGALASRLCDEDPSAGLLLALRAMDRSPNAVARTALYRSLATSALETTIEGLWPQATTEAFSPDGRWLAAGSAAGAIEIMEIATHRIRHHLRGHGGAIIALAFDPSGRRLVSGSVDATARIWDLEDGTQQSVLDGHTRALKVVCFDPTGRLVLTGSHDGTACLWDAANGRLLHRLEGHEGAVTAGGFSPDGHLVATASGDIGLGGDVDSVHADNTARVWEVSTGRLLFTVQHADWVTWVEFDRQSRHIVTSGRDGLVEVADAHDGRLLHRLSIPSPVRCVRFHPDGTRVVTVFDPVPEDGSIYRSGVLVWDIAHERPVLTPAGHDGQTVSGVAWSPDGNRLATASYDRTIRIWSAATGAEEACFRGHSRFVYSICWSPDGRFLASHGPESWVGLWCASGSRVIPPLHAERGPIRNICFAPDGSTVATVGEDGGVCLTSLPERQVVRVLEPGEDRERPAARIVTFDESGRRLAVGREDGSVSLWPLKGDRPPVTLQGREGPIDWLAFGGKGRRLVGGSKGHGAVLWDLDARRVLVSLQAEGGLRCLAVSPDGERFATGDDRRTTRLYDLATGRLLWEFVYRSRFTVHQEVVTLRFSPDGHRLVVMPPGGRAHLLDVQNGRQVAQWTGVVAGPVAFDPAGELAAFGHRFGPRLALVDCRDGRVCTGLRGHEDAIRSVAFESDGGRLLSASRDGTVRLWDLATHRLDATLSGRDGPLRWAGFSPDDHWIATLAEGGTVRLWPVDPLAAARRTLPRTLRPGELTSLGVPAAER